MLALPLCVAVRRFAVRARASGCEWLCSVVRLATRGETRADASCMHTYSASTHRASSHRASSQMASSHMTHHTHQSQSGEMTCDQDESVDGRSTSDDQIASISSHPSDRIHQIPRARVFTTAFTHTPTQNPQLVMNLYKNPRYPAYLETRDHLGIFVSPQILSP